MDPILRCVPPQSVLTGWDFSTGACKALAFDLQGNVLAEARFATDLWTAGGVSELNLLLLEGQARATTRALAARLREIGRLNDWAAGGISATHHTAGRIDIDGNPIRRAICWNDPTLASYHAIGLERLGGQERVRSLIGGPWASRYTLSHLVKDEQTLPRTAWEATWRILPHASLAAGYLTGNFDAISVSSAASTGLMDLRSCQWQPAMLEALASEDYRNRVLKALPPILAQEVPMGPLSEALCDEWGIRSAPLIFPPSDDQAAGLIGGGAVDEGHVAIILGNSAVVNSSSYQMPQSGSLDVMRLNWGPYLWMRCYNNGAQFLDGILGDKPDWAALEQAGQAVPPGCNGARVRPFLHPEPSLGVAEPCLAWTPHEPSELGVRYRAALEALAYLIARAVREHEQAGQTITRLTVSGGIAQSNLMLEILASVLNRTLDRLQSSEGPALGAAVTALAALENSRRLERNLPGTYPLEAAVRQLVRFQDAVPPRADWVAVYQQALNNLSY